MAEETANFLDNFNRYLRTRESAMRFDNYVEIPHDSFTPAIAPGGRIEYGTHTPSRYPGYSSDPTVLPKFLPPEIDPAYHYSVYAQKDRTTDRILDEMIRLKGMHDRLPNGTIDKQVIGNMYEGERRSYADWNSRAQQSMETAQQADIALKRQQQIAQIRANNPNANGLASLIEGNAQSYREHASRDMATTASKRRILDGMQRYMGEWDKMLEKLGVPFKNKGGYLLEGVGSLAMAPDVHRLMTGGGLGSDGEGNPVIMSKAEMQDAAGVPFDFQNSYRDFTPEESKAQQDKWDAEDKEARQKEALLKSVTDANRFSKNAAKSDFWSEIISK